MNNTVILVTISAGLKSLELNTKIKSLSCKVIVSNYIDQHELHNNSVSPKCTMSMKTAATENIQQ